MSSRANARDVAGSRAGPMAEERDITTLVFDDNRLLTPLFGALHSVAHDGMPRIEIQIVPRHVTIEVPVEVVVERFVDRMVYVPIPMASLQPWTRSLWDLSRWDLSRLPRPGCRHCCARC